MSATAVKPDAPRGQRSVPDSVPAIVTAVALLALWEGAVKVLEIPAFILPTPSSVAIRIVDDLATGVILPHLWTTFIEVAVGFVLAALLGVALGTMVALVRALEKTIYPIVLALQTVPKVAIAPLLIIWFGYGIHSKAVTAGLIAFFPIMVNVIVGLKTVDHRRVLLMQALRAGPVKTYLKVRLPSMLPYLFAGLEVGIIFSVIGAIVGEFVGSSVGLGTLIIQRQATVDVAGVFSVLAYLSIMGLVLSLIIKAFAHRLTFWARSQEIVSP
ncbi:ABC transporter permease [Enterovirga sp.]|uniref:ABC transporter permease n=1 Tax=Enterovirga sp. TaxID=2026350 RepID=UPI002602ADD9|nr:ABC transporter permease [Enterovirga sp.]MDB5592042.1 binding-protein-dependent transport system inner rane protein [Enterovirga sp.]